MQQPFSLLLLVIICIVAPTILIGLQGSSLSLKHRTVCFGLFNLPTHGSTKNKVRPLHLSFGAQSWSTGLVYLNSCFRVSRYGRVKLFLVVLGLDYIGYSSSR